MAKSELSVGELAKRAGVKVSALHFYEQKGLITSRRNDGNQRRYDRAMLRRVAMIKAAQQIGVSLAAIKVALDSLPIEKTPTNLDWQRLSKVWRSELDERIAHLVKLRDELNECIGCGCLSMKACPLRNPDDVLSKQGGGAHLL